MPTLDDLPTFESLTIGEIAADDLWLVFDSSANKLRKVTDAERRKGNTYDGEPSNYVAEIAATPMSETYTVDSDKTVILTAKTSGVQSPAPKLVVSAPNALPAGANATLAIVSQAAGVVTVRPATGAGDNSAVTVGTGNGALTVTAPDAGVYTLQVGLNTSGNTLAVSSLGVNLDIYLAMDTGTAAEWAITDASGGEDSLIAITGPSGFDIDPTPFSYVTFESRVTPGISAPLVIDESEYPNIVIWLPTSETGDVVSTAASTIAAALGAFGGANFIGSDWTFTPAVLDENWDSYNAPQGASTPAVAPAPLTDGSNSATAVAAAIEADTDFTAVAGGTGADDVGVQSEVFTGGGANSTITTTLAQLTTLLNAAPSTIIGCAAGAGSQATVIEATAGVTLTGGSDLVPAVPGTPAYLGRTATDGTDVWTAFTDNYTTTQNGWVKTFTGS